MKEISRDVFHPREGAILDLESLQVLARAPSESLAAWMASRWPGAAGLILEGLDLEGDPSPGGPPGSVRPDGLTGGAVITPGKAAVTARDGRMHLIEVREPVHCPWPDASGPKVRGGVVLFVAHGEAGHDQGLAVARERITVRAGFVKPNLLHEPLLLPIAYAVGNGADWATDVARVFQPEHACVRQLLKRFEKLEQSVWQAEPEGSVWDRQVLGRSWVRYQTVAAAALQSARMQLATQSMTTLERVRLMQELRHQLERSVERTATELLQLLGPPDGAGPYRQVAGQVR